MIYLCLRFLREFEKWSKFFFKKKNCGKWVKIAAPESPYTHYSRLSKTLHMCKGDIARDEQFLLFQQCFLPFKRTLNSLLQSLSIWKSLIFIIWERVKPLRASIMTSVTRRLHSLFYIVYG